MSNIFSKHLGPSLLLEFAAFGKLQGAMSWVQFRLRRRPPRSQCIDVSWAFESIDRFAPAGIVTCWYRTKSNYWTVDGFPYELWISSCIPTSMDTEIRYTPALRHFMSPRHVFPLQNDTRQIRNRFEPSRLTKPQKENILIRKDNAILTGDKFIFPSLFYQRGQRQLCLAGTIWMMAPMPLVLCILMQKLWGPGRIRWSHEVEMILTWINRFV